MRRFAYGLIAALVLLSLPTKAGTAQAQTSLLIRYRVTNVDTLAGTVSTEDSLIFRDGLVIQESTHGLGQCQIVRGAALPRELADLREALVRNHVGAQQGRCASNIAPGEIRNERKVTWFGQRDRQASFTIGTALGQLCPAAVFEIDFAIQELLDTISDKQAALTCP